MAPLDTCDTRELQLHAISRDLSSAESGRGVRPRLAIAVFLLVCVFCMLASYLGRHSQGVATIWLSNGLLFAIVIRQPRRAWAAYLGVGYCADLFGAVLIDGESFLSSVIVTACNSFEVALTALLLHRWFGASFKLSRPRHLFAFFGTGVLLAPALACALASLWLALEAHTDWGASYLTWFLGDAIGMAIVAPLVYTVQDPDFFSIFRPRLLPKTLVSIAAPFLAASMDFAQRTAPFPLFIMPALIYATFRRGFQGAAIGVFLTACAAISLTIRGHGLMTLTPDHGLLHNIVLVQIFIAATLFTIFPIAALLEESESLALSLKQSETRYMELANTDALTGQANRRAFDHRLETEWQRAAALHHPLSLLSLDIDHFKAYNDLYGHIAGDDCLRQVAFLAATALHQCTSARLYRVGGEEFAVILPEADLAEAHALAERIRLSVFAAHIEHKGSALGHQTISVGLVTAVPSLGQPALSLLAQSDKALYAAKHNGRNRCEAAA